MKDIKDIKYFFETIYRDYNNKNHIATDPIVFPHTVSGNIEYIAFTSALFAYGNVKAIQRFLSSYFNEIGTDPYNLKSNEKLKYRFQTVKDINVYIEIIKHIYGEYGSLEAIFKGEDTPLNGGIKGMQTILNLVDDTNLTHGLKFLFALPGKSPSKRLHMFLRWMIRKDDVDFGLWSQSYSSSGLYMPMDTHIGRMATHFGIIKSNEKGVTALNKINTFFQLLNAEDPVKYDFALTRLGIVIECKYMSEKACKDCVYKYMCVFN